MGLQLEVGVWRAPILFVCLCVAFNRAKWKRAWNILRNLLQHCLQRIGRTFQSRGIQKVEMRIEEVKKLVLNQTAVHSSGAFPIPLRQHPTGPNHQLNKTINHRNDDDNIVDDDDIVWFGTNLCLACRGCVGMPRVAALMLRCCGKPRKWRWKSSSGPSASGQSCRWLRCRWSGHWSVWRHWSEFSILGNRVGKIRCWNEYKISLSLQFYLFPPREGPATSDDPPQSHDYKLKCVSYLIDKSKI